MDPYQVLQIKRGSSKEEIKKAFFKLAKIHHPDKGGKQEDFVRIKKAYDTLMAGNEGFTKGSWAESRSEEYASWRDADTSGFSQQDEWEQWKENFRKAREYQERVFHGFHRRQAKFSEILNKQQEIQNLKYRLNLAEKELQEMLASYGI